MNPSDSLQLRFRAPIDEFVLDFNDDGKVAYAYLKNAHDAIVGDVWVYNRCRAPERSEWKDKANIPFANCAGFASDVEMMTRSINDGDVAVEWQYDKGSPVARIYLFNELYAVVGVGDKPGSARLATKNGPLAKVMFAN